MAGASPYGVEELSGGVFEWTRSLWGNDFQKSSHNYPYLMDDGREELAASERTLRILRSASFYGDAGHIRASARGGYGPNDRFNFGGFRLVLVPLSRV